MDWIGIQIDAQGLQTWLQETWAWAAPKLAVSLVVAVVATLAWPVARWVLRRIERHLTRKTASEVDDHVLELVRACALLSIAFVALWRIARVWELPTVGRVIVGLWIVALTLPLSRFLAQMLAIVEKRVAPRTETTLDDTALPLVNKVVRALVIALGVLLALSELGVDITPLVAGAGVAGIAISLAAQDTLSNLIAGVLLILDRPFEVGDRIELWTAPTETGTWGDVIEIGLRATKIRNPDNLVFVVPNNEIMRRDIINYTSSGDHIRIRIPIDIAYDADAEKAKEIIHRVAGETPGVLQDPEPKVIIRSFGESGVNLQLRVWIPDARRRRAIADAITDRVKHAFDREGVEIPYPKRDIFVRSLPAAGRGDTDGQTTLPADALVEPAPRATQQTGEDDDDERQRAGSGQAS